MTLDQLIVGAKQYRDSLGDGRDLRTDREQEAFEVNYKKAQRIASGLMNFPDDVAHLQARLDEALAKQAASEQKHAQLKALLDDDEDGRYAQQLRLLSEGKLLAAPTVVFWAPEYAAQRVAELTDRRDRAQSALNACVREAEELLGTTA